jgi:hypothetical protein
VLFSLGLATALALAAAVVWADLEASTFDVSLIGGSEPLSSLRCPVMMSRNETAQLTASVTNPSDRAVRLSVRAHISDGFVSLIREERELLELAPGETRRLSWAIAPQDAAYGRIVLARVHVLRAGPEHPHRQRSCGVLVLGLPFSGHAFAWLLATSSVAAMAAAAYGWWRSRPSRLLRYDQGTLFMAVLTLLASAALVGAFGSWWIVGAGILVVTALLLSAIVGYLLAGH